MTVAPLPSAAPGEGGREDLGAPRALGASGPRLAALVVAQQRLLEAPADSTALLTELARTAAELCGAAGSEASLLDGDGRGVVTAAAVGHTLTAPGERIPLDGSLVGLALRTRRPQRGPSALPGLGQVTQAPASTLVVPLLRGTATLGALLLSSPRPRAFTVEDEALLELLAPVAAVRLSETLVADELNRLRRSGPTRGAAPSPTRGVDGELADLRAAQQLAGLCTWSHDPATDTSVWSDDLFVLLGEAPRAFPPHPDRFASYLHPLDRSSALLTRLTGTSTPSHDLVRVVRPDGTVRHLECWARAEVDEHGAVVLLRGTVLDVTGREQVRQELAESDKHLRVAFDGAPHGTLLVSLSDDPGAFLHANPAFCELVGLDLDDVVRLHPADVVHADDLALVQSQAADLLAGRATGHVAELRLVHRDGSEVQVSATTKVVNGNDGRPLYAVHHVVDMTSRRETQAELGRLSREDVLTGLANRSRLQQEVGAALARQAVRGGTTALLMLDLDRFKVVNDSLGHQVGDELLAAVAHRLVAATRAGTVLARVGGDEFVVLLEGAASQAEVEQVAERLVGTARSPWSLSDGTTTVSCTASVGIAVTRGRGKDADDLYREAELALYRAKETGRDRWSPFDDELRSRAVARLASEQRLRDAIDHDELCVQFQPVVDLATGGICGSEALVRIDDGDRGLLPPAEFIEVAEESGLIVDLDVAVVTEAVRRTAGLAAAVGGHPARVAVNVSSRSLDAGRTVDAIAAVLATSGLPGSSLDVEITERSLLEMTSTTGDSLARLRAMGVRIGIDDFGTGYSALAYLQSVALDFLKIDRSFVSRLGSSPSADAVVGAIIDLAHAHDLVVVAEGVETPEQLERLRSLGCDEAQGYLFGRSMAVEDLERLVVGDTRW